ncbi:MAG: cytochrome c oxidase assembly protein [Pseudomonadota bacterium]|jgi:cytochrome c oxidase assembly protein subunit 11|nr:cytochrome c oxidase assembly protein [Pseudomonadota bacterium]
MTKNRKQQRKQATLLVLLATGMFGFAFALVPLYEIFCEVTGFNGRTFGQTTASVEQFSQVVGREVTIEFVAHVGRGMPWEFRPTESRLRVRTGEVSETKFYARNYANKLVTGQAVPSVTPGAASLSLHKIECFCFTQQQLEAGEEVEMPVLFYVDDDLPADIGTLSLSYTLYPVPDAQVVTLDDDVRGSPTPILEHSEEHSGS